MSRQHNRSTAVRARPNGATETSEKQSLYRRLTLRRSDGRVYLNRWGLAHDKIGGILLHRMGAPDPGQDLHDHPWSFISIVLWGGYTEIRTETRIAVRLARTARLFSAHWTGLRGHHEHRYPGSIRMMRLDECHTITALRRRHCWTIVLRGPRRRAWGFYTPDGYLDEKVYDETIRAQRRDLWSDQNKAARPW